MEKRRIGSLQVSIVGLGCNNFGRKLDFKGTSLVVDAAIDAGIDLFDTADIYGGTKSEEFLGGALGPRRSQVNIATKFGMQVDDKRQGAHPAYVRQAAEDSLKRLGTDYIDLYYLHKPDPSVPIADTLGALDELVRAGKVREIGCSQFSAAQLREAQSAAPNDAAHFVVVQNDYSLSDREAEREVIPECVRSRIAFVPFFPLANGLLTGKYRLGQPAPAGSRIGSGWHGELFTDKNLVVVERLMRFAESRGHTMLELAISWLASHEVVASVIAGATSPDQVRANAAAASWRLTSAEMAEVDAIVPASAP
jgi:aryl-alcohol dehydrogenase-like predicted oxidoreductase